MSRWERLKFMVVDGWKSRHEGQKLGSKDAPALRDALHVSAGRQKSGFSSSEEAINMAIEANDRYEASFEDD